MQLYLIYSYFQPEADRYHQKLECQVESVLGASLAICYQDGIGDKSRFLWNGMKKRLYIQKYENDTELLLLKNPPFFPTPKGPYMFKTSFSLHGILQAFPPAYFLIKTCLLVSDL